MYGPDLISNLIAGQNRAYPPKKLVFEAKGKYGQSTRVFLLLHLFIQHTELQRIIRLISFKDYRNYDRLCAPFLQEYALCLFAPSVERADEQGM